MINHVVIVRSDSWWKQRWVSLWGGGGIHSYCEERIHRRRYFQQKQNDLFTECIIPFFGVFKGDSLQHRIRFFLQLNTYSERNRFI